jgi:hypothetical protein
MSMKKVKDLEQPDREQTDAAESDRDTVEESLHIHEAQEKKNTDEGKSSGAGDKDRAYHPDAPDKSRA